MNDSVSASATAPSVTSRQRLGRWLLAGLGWLYGVSTWLRRPFYAAYQRRLEAAAASWRIPRHIGIIMDGNRRFARHQHLLNVTDGHVRGADKLEDVLNWCEEVGVQIVTVWIFSLDNFKRDPDEVDMLMQLFERKFLELVKHPRIHRNQIRVRSLGKVESLPESAIDSGLDQAYPFRVQQVGLPQLALLICFCRPSRPTAPTMTSVPMT